MKNIIYKYSAFILGIAFLSSCEFFHDVNKQDEPEIEYSSTFPISGEWYVQFDHETLGEDPNGAGLVPLFTYNTAADDGRNIWLSDDGNFWDFKVKIECDVKSLSFGTADSVANVSYDVNVLLQNGKIIKNASLQPSGVYMDSIYFEVAFGDEDGKFLVSGFRRSGFLEDEH